MGQLCATASMSANLVQCRILVQKAVSAGAKVRPEALNAVRVADALTGFISSRGFGLYQLLRSGIIIPCTLRAGERICIGPSK